MDSSVLSIFYSFPYLMGELSCDLHNAWSKYVPCMCELRVYTR